MRGPNLILRSVMAQTQQLLAVESLVRRFIQDEFHVGSIDDGLLTLVTPNSAIATRIRYSERDIISSLQQAANDLAVQRLRIIVRPEISRAAPEPPKPCRLSAESARQLAGTAEYIDYKPLRKALLALSRRVKDDQRT